MTSSVSGTEGRKKAESLAYSDSSCGEVIGGGVSSEYVDQIPSRENLNVIVDLRV
jgi:hypothetical protein